MDGWQHEKEERACAASSVHLKTTFFAATPSSLWLRMAIFESHYFALRFGFAVVLGREGDWRMAQSKCTSSCATKR